MHGKTNPLLFSTLFCKVTLSLTWVCHWCEYQLLWTVLFKYPALLKTCPWVYFLGEIWESLQFWPVGRGVREFHLVKWSWISSVVDHSQRSTECYGFKASGVLAIAQRCQLGFFIRTTRFQCKWYNFSLPKPLSSSTAKQQQNNNFIDLHWTYHKATGGNTWTRLDAKLKRIRRVKTASRFDKTYKWSSCDNSKFKKTLLQSFC